MSEDYSIRRADEDAEYQRLEQFHRERANEQAPGWWVQWVGQEDPMGCGIACAAMLTGQTYATVRREFTIDISKGTTNRTIEAYLVEYGFTIARVCDRKPWVKGRSKRDPWPAPTGDINLAIVKVQGGNHSVIVFRDGTVYDPAINPPWPALRIDDPRYLRVYSIAEIRRLDERDHLVRAAGIAAEERGRLLRAAEAAHVTLARCGLPISAYRTTEDGQEECPYCTSKGPSIAEILHGSECPVLERRMLLGLKDG